MKSEKNETFVPLLRADYQALCAGREPPGWEGIRTWSTAQVYFHKISGCQYCKIYPQPSLFKRLLNRIKGIPLGRLRRKQKLLAGLGFRTPLILTHGCVDGRIYVVSRAVEGMTLLAYMRSYEYDRIDQAAFKEKRQLLKIVAEEIARMHGERVRYGDLNANNIIVNRKNRKFAYLDYESSRRLFARSQKHIERNLQQLNACKEQGLSNTDRCYFLKYYERYLKDNYNVSCESLARRVMARTMARWKANAHK